MVLAAAGALLAALWDKVCSRGAWYGEVRRVGLGVSAGSEDRTGGSALVSGSMVSAVLPLHFPDKYHVAYIWAQGTAYQYFIKRVLTCMGKRRRV